MSLQIYFAIFVTILSFVIFFLAYNKGWFKRGFKLLSNLIYDIKYSKIHITISIFIIGFVIAYLYFKAGIEQTEEANLQALIQSLGVAIVVLILKVPFETYLERFLDDLTLRRFPHREFAYEFLPLVFDVDRYDDRIYIFGGDLDFLWDSHYDSAREKLAEKKGQEIYIICYDPRSVTRKKGLETISSIKRLMGPDFCIEKIYFTPGNYRGVILRDIVGIMTHEPIKGRLEYVRVLAPPDESFRSDWMYYSTDKKIIEQMNNLAKDICLAGNEVKPTTIKEIEVELNRKLDAQFEAIL